MWSAPSETACPVAWVSKGQHALWSFLWRWALQNSCPAGSRVLPSSSTAEEGAGHSWVHRGLAPLSPGGLLWPGVPLLGNPASGAPNPALRWGSSLTPNVGKSFTCPWGSFLFLLFLVRPNSPYPFGSLKVPLNPPAVDSQLCLEREAGVYYPLPRSGSCCPPLPHPPLRDCGAGKVRSDAQSQRRRLPPGATVGAPPVPSLPFRHQDASRVRGGKLLYFIS